MSKKICQAGRCHCGAVEYKVDGDIVFNALCHCKNCTRAVGASPLHIIGVAPKTALTVTKGEDKLVCRGEAVPRYFCGVCGTLIHQGPAGMDLRAVTPSAFHLEGKLPDDYLPTVHWNYESRHWDHNDNLVKFKELWDSPKLDNQGQEIKA